MKTRSFLLALVAMNLAVWLLVCSSPQSAQTSVEKFGFSPARLTQALEHGDYKVVGIEAVRSVSQLFVHQDDFFHVGLNMLVLVLFGIAVERRLGPGKFTALYTLSGVATCFIYALICPDGLTCFGASAAVFGVMGAFAYLKAKERSILAILPFGLLVLNMMLATNDQMLKLLGFGPWAHAIGFMCGLLIALLVAPKPSPTRTLRRQSPPASALVATGR